MCAACAPDVDCVTSDWVGTIVLAEDHGSHSRSESFEVNSVWSVVSGSDPVADEDVWYTYSGEHCPDLSGFVLESVVFGVICDFVGWVSWSS